MEISSIWGCANSLQLRHSDSYHLPNCVKKKPSLFVRALLLLEANVYVYINVIYTLIYVKLSCSRKIPGFIPECDLFEKLMAHMQNSLILLRVKSALENEVWESCTSNCIGKGSIRSRRKSILTVHDSEPVFVQHFLWAEVSEWYCLQTSFSLCSCN